MAETQLSQELLLAARSGQSTSRLTQTILEVAYAPPATKDARVTQIATLAALSSGDDNVTTNVSQMGLLVAYKDTDPGVARQQVWTFVLDGHRFFVLPLGEEGDWAYDTTTKEWCQLQTQGFNGLNFGRGVMWGIRIMGGDSLQPVLTEMTPTEAFDDGWRDIKRIVTGGVATRARSNIGVANFSVVASVDDVDSIGNTINLSFSDNNGGTWSNEIPIALTGEPNQTLIWNALGSFASPGRIFRITDEAGPVRLDGADVVLNYSNGADSGTDQDK